MPSLYASLGIYIPLIVVNCIILGRAESYASKNGVWLSMFDGIGMGLGFTIGLTAIGIFRELFGNGTIFGFRLMPESYEPVTILILAPGAFFVLACLIAIQNKVRIERAKKDGMTVTTCEKASDCNDSNSKWKCIKKKISFSGKEKALFETCGTYETHACTQITFASTT